MISSGRRAFFSYARWGLATAAGVSPMRLSPHIYNTMAEVERVIDVITSLT
jgi:selenocysteine lyase/cysteine desulfurase